MWSVHAANPGEVHKVKTADQGANWTTEVVTLSAELASNQTTVGSSGVTRASNGDIFINGNGSLVKRYTSAGAYIPGQNVGTVGSMTGVKYFEADGVPHVAVYAYRELPAGTDPVLGYTKVFDVSDPAAPVKVATSPKLASAASGNAISGDVSVRVNPDGTYIVYALGATQGLIAYGTKYEEVDPNAPLAGEYFIPQGSNSAGFATLADAVAAVNNNGVSAAVTFLIDDDLDATSSMIRINRTDLTSSTRVTFKPAPGKTPTISVNDLRLVDTGYVTFDGSNNGTDSRDMTILQVDPTSIGPIRVFSDSRDEEYKNLNISFATTTTITAFALRINRHEESGETGRSIDLVFKNNKVGSDEKPYPVGIEIFGAIGNLQYHEGTFIQGNEFNITRSSVRTQNHISTVFDSNVINHYVGDFTPIESFRLNTPHNTFEFTNNEINIVSSTRAAAATIIGLEITNSITENGVYVVNNMISAAGFSGAGTAHNFYGIRHNGAATTSDVWIYHNTIRLGDTGNSGVHAGIAKAAGASNGGKFVVTNNIISVERNAANSNGFVWTGSDLTSDYNNIVIAP